MSESTITRLAMALGVAILLWGALALTSGLREDRASRIKLPRVDTAAVDTVRIARAGDSATIARGAKGAWSVNGNPADTARVHELLRALVDTSAWGEVAAQSASSWPRLGVGADSGRHVTIASRGRSLLDLTAGKRTEDYGGIYVRRGTDSAVYALHGAYADPLTRSADDWRDKRIARVVPESVATAELRRGARNFTLKREGAKWTLNGGATDSAAAAGVVEAYRTLDASGFATKAQGDSADFRKATGGVRLKSKTGATLLGLTFDSTAGGVWARADSGGPVYKLDAWQMGRLVPAESTLKVKEKKKGK